MTYRALLRRLLGGPTPPAPPAPPAVRSDFPPMRVHRGENEMTVGVSLHAAISGPIAKLSPAEVERYFGIPHGAA